MRTCDRRYVVYYVYVIIDGLVPRYGATCRTTLSWHERALLRNRQVRWGGRRLAHRLVRSVVGRTMRIVCFVGFRVIEAGWATLFALRESV